MINFLQCMDTVAFSIGDLDVAWYGIIVTSAIICAFFLFLYMSKKQGLDDDFTLESFIWVLVLAIIFARVFYVVPRIGTTYHTFAQMINIREGGLTIIGGIFGGILGIIISTFKNRKYHLTKLSDAVVLPVMLGQIIGRWGNFVNQELFGVEITNPTFQKFPFAVYIENPSVHYAGCEPGWYCALFFYEGAINAIGLIIALILYHKFKNKIKPMTLTIGYLTWYGLVRGCLEFLKIDHATIGNSNVGIVQLMCFFMAAVGIIVLVLLYTNKIGFESKKFQDLCDKHWDEIKNKQVKVTSSGSSEENVENNVTNKDMVSDDSKDDTNKQQGEDKK